MAWTEYLPPRPYTYNKIVFPSTVPGSKILLVGEAPGFEEINAGKCFIGAAGKILNSLLYQARINREEVSITNVSLERPIDNKFRAHFYTKNGSRYEPTDRLRQWRKCLREYTKELNPNLIVAMGDEALKALTGLSGITKYRGSLLKSHDGIKVLACLHPAYLLRQYRAMSVALFDMRKAKCEGEFPELVEPEMNIKISPSLEEVLDRLTWIQEKKVPIVIDLETRENHIACIGIGYSPTEAIVIPFMRVIGHYWTEENERIILQELFKILLDEKIPKIGQNFISFDCRIMDFEWGATVRNIVFDTMHAHHRIYMERFGPNMGHGLEFLTSLYTDIPYYKDEGKVWERSIGEEQFWNYCGKDCIATYQSWIGIKEELIETKQERHYYEYTLPLSLTLRDIQVRGLKVDIKTRDRLIGEKEKEYDAIQGILNKALELAGLDHLVPLNTNSHVQLKNLFYKELQIPVEKTGYGAKRKISVDETALSMIKLKNKQISLFIDFILRHKELQKELSFLNTPISPEGRMHSLLVISGTETGRLASKADITGWGTNLQNVKNPLRRIFIPDDGYVFWEADASQAEARVVAVLAQQWDLVDLFSRGDIDVHWENAKRLFHLAEDLPYDQHNPEHYRMRYLAKRVIHASNYGMSWVKLRLLLLVDAGIWLPEKDVKELLERYHQIYPNIRKVFQQGIIDKIQKDRELVTPFGRRRIFNDRLGDELYRSAFAFIPQSTVVDLVNKALLDFDRWSKKTLKRCLVMNQVHDSILYQVKPQIEYAAARELKRLMERPINLNDYELIIPAEFARGHNWAKASKDNPDGMKEVKIN